MNTSGNLMPNSIIPCKIRAIILYVLIREPQNTETLQLSRFNPGRFFCHRLSLHLTVIVQLFLALNDDEWSRQRDFGMQEILTQIHTIPQITH